MTRDQELIRRLGRTRTVEDVQAAYNRIFEAERKASIALRRAKSDTAQFRAELASFLDDLRAITGLSFESKQFWKIASLTIARRLARRNLMQNEFHSALHGFIDDAGEMEDLP